MIYISTIIITFALTYLSRKRNNTFLYILAAFILIILSTYRDTSVGIDVKVYLEPLFYKCKLNDNFLSVYLMSEQEVLFVGLVFLATKVFGSISGCFFVIAVLSIVPVFVAIYRQKDDIYIEMAVIFYTCICYPWTLNQMRQSIAMGLLLYGFSLLRNKRLIKCLLFVFIAMGFHKSAIVFIGLIVLWLVRDSRFLNKTRGLLILVAYLLIIYYDKILKYLVNNISFLPKRYITNEYIYSDYNFPILYAVMTSLILTMAYLSFKYNRDENFFWLLIAGIVFCGTFVMAKSQHIVRVFMYPEMLLMLFVSKKDLVIVSQSHSNRIVGNGIICMVLVIYFCFEQIYSNSCGLMPYIFAI